MSPTRPLLVLTLILGACTGSINQGKDLYGADDDSATDTGAPTDSGGGDDSSGDDSSGGDDSTADDSTVIDDSGGDDTEDSEAEGWPGSCGNFWDPVDIFGWSRSYAIVYNGQTGTEFQTGEGEIAASGLFRFTTDMVLADGSGWAGYQDVGCDVGGQEGLFVDYWEVAYLGAGGSATGTFAGTHSVQRMYLPDEAFIGGVGSWSYDYTLTITMKGDPASGGTDIPFEMNSKGTYVELNEVTVVLDGVEVPGYRLTNTYTITYAGFLGTGAFVREGYIDQVYVAGIGLVTESHTATFDNGNTYDLSKTLTSYTGLARVEP